MALLVGFEILKVITVPAVLPGTGLAPLTVMVGRLVFVANTGAVAGTKTRSPEIARSARIVPELNFVTYAFVSVFNIFVPADPDGLYKRDG